MDLRISCGTRKLARTPRIIYIKKKKLIYVYLITQPIKDTKTHAYTFYFLVSILSRQTPLRIRDFTLQLTPACLHQQAHY
jgi:hypothetical protein